MADVAPFEVRDPIVGAEPFVELSVPDVERDHVRGPTLQQAVGEPAGRGAGVERPPVTDVDVEHVECMIELVCATADEARRRPLDDHRVSGCDLTRRLVGDRTVDEHTVGVDQLPVPRYGST